MSAPDEPAGQTGVPNEPSAEERQHVPPLTTRVVIAEDEALIRLDLKEMLRRRATPSSARRATGSRPSSSPRSSGRTW